MAKWVCPVCGYIHEGDEARHGKALKGLLDRYFN